jgi:hypothetical protein
MERTVVLKEFKVKRITVNCEPNDRSDIMAGGPLMLGYDFFVKEEEASEIEEVIRKLFIKLNKHSVDVFSGDTCWIDKRYVWTKKRIEDRIKKGYY